MNLSIATLAPRRKLTRSERRTLAEITLNARNSVAELVNAGEIAADQFDAAAQHLARRNVFDALRRLAPPPEHFLPEESTTEAEDGEQYAPPPFGTFDASGAVQPGRLSTVPDPLAVRAFAIADDVIDTTGLLTILPDPHRDIFIESLGLSGAEPQGIRAIAARFGMSKSAIARLLQGTWVLLGQFARVNPIIEIRTSDGRIFEMLDKNELAKLTHTDAKRVIRRELGRGLHRIRHELNQPLIPSTCFWRASIDHMVRAVNDDSIASQSANELHEEISERYEKYKKVST